MACGAAQPDYPPGFAVETSLNPSGADVLPRRMNWKGEENRGQAAVKLPAR